MLTSVMKHITIAYGGLCYTAGARVQQDALFQCEHLTLLASPSGAKEHFSHHNKSRPTEAGLNHPTCPPLAHGRMAECGG